MKKVCGLLATVGCHRARGGKIGPMRKKGREKWQIPLTVYVRLLPTHLFPPPPQNPSIQNVEELIGHFFGAEPWRAYPLRLLQGCFFSDDISISVELHSQEEQMAPLGGRGCSQWTACVLPTDVTCGIIK